MALIKVEIGPFESLFIGDFTASSPLSATELVEITSLTTGPSKLYEGYEDQYFAGIDKQLQVGTYQTIIPFTFLDNTNILVHSLARGLSVGNTDINTPPTNMFYTLLLIHPDSTSRNSVLIKKCRTKRDKRVTRSKTSASSVVLLFTAESPSVYSGELKYGTPDELSAILGARSPL